MTSELGPSARALLEAARGGGPDAAAIARMRGKIDAAVTPAATATVTGSLASKLGLVALALVVATGAIVLVTRKGAEPAAHEIVTSPPIREAAEARSGAAQFGQRSDEAVTIDPTAIEIETPPSQRRATGPVARVAPKAAPIGLAREVELVDRAMTALRRGEPRAALAAVRHHATETSHRGQLAEDATAIEIEALCTLRDPSAAARLSAFDVRWPASVQRAKLARACR